MTSFILIIIENDEKQSTFKYAILRFSEKSQM